jgi:hypothetical protein
MFIYEEDQSYLVFLEQKTLYPQVAGSNPSMKKDKKDDSFWFYETSPSDVGFVWIKIFFKAGF